MRLTRSPPDCNWATWLIYVASLPTGNSGGRCPHHSSLLNMGPSLIPYDESGPGGIGFMVSPMHRLRSLASASEFRCPSTHPSGKGPIAPKDYSIRGRVALPFKVASSSQAKQGGIMMLTRSPLDYNWATWPIYVASLPTGNSGGRCPHQLLPCKS
jgi:hypothetical protein